MNHELLTAIQAAAVVVGISTGGISAYVVLQVKALRSELRAELILSESRILQRINGTYVRTVECKLRDGAVHEALDMLRDRIMGVGA